MKFIKTVIIALILATTANAKSKFDIAIDANKIQDIQTLSGDVFTISDLQDGYLKIENSLVKNNIVYLNQNAPIKDVYLNNGELVKFNKFFTTALLGGDMGGGGKK